MGFINKKPLYRHYASSFCRCCCAPIISAHDCDDESSRWIVHETRQTKGEQTVISLLQACETCADMEERLAEAKSDGRRYTAVSTYNHDCENGRRCQCGAVSVGHLGYCVRCSKAHRMLDKKQAENRMIATLLADLKKQAKETLKGESYGR